MSTKYLRLAQIIAHERTLIGLDKEGIVWRYNHEKHVWMRVTMEMES